MKSFRQRPVVFESLKAARREPGGSRRMVWFFFFSPGLEYFACVKGRNQRTHLCPDCGFRPNKAGAARPEDPLMSAGSEGIAVHRDDLGVFHADAVHAVHDQEHAVFFITAIIHFGNYIGNAADRKP